MWVRGFVVVLAVASLATFRASAAEEPEIVAKAIKDAEQSCAEMGGKPSTEAILSVDDINGDGGEDWVVDYSKMKCEGTTNPFCGNSGCSLSIYLWKRDSTWRLAYDDMVQSFEINKTDQRRMLITESSPDACDKADGVCEEKFTITKDSIRLVGDRDSRRGASRHRHHHHPHHRSKQGKRHKHRR